MLRMTFITVGDLPRGPFQEIGDEFEKRLKLFVTMEKKSVKSEEAILRAIPDGSFVVVLDAAGKALTTEAFARRIGQQEDDGRHVTVILGGPFGLSDSLKAGADLQLSLSPMTTTHDLAHLFFLEQLYRAFTLLRGKTYHY